MDLQTYLLTNQYRNPLVSTAFIDSAYAPFNNESNITMLQNVLLNEYGDREMCDYIDNITALKSQDYIITVRNIVESAINMREPVWKNLWLAVSAEYNPIENYSMTENGTDTTDNTLNKGIQTDSEQHQAYTDTTQDQVAPYDSSVYNNQMQTNFNGGQRESSYINGSRQDTAKNVVTHELKRSGNIGVTTSQQMIQSEIDLRKYSFWREIAEVIATLISKNKEVLAL